MVAECFKPILDNEDLWWDLYNVSHLKRDFDAAHGLNASISSLDEGVDSTVSASFWKILDSLGLNTPTLNFYLDI